LSQVAPARWGVTTRSSRPNSDNRRLLGEVAERGGVDRALLRCCAESSLVDALPCSLCPAKRRSRHSQGLCRVRCGCSQGFNSRRRGHSAAGSPAHSRAHTQADIDEGSEEAPGRCLAAIRHLSEWCSCATIGEHTQNDRVTSIPTL
jgi:hypothetical protein